MLLLALAISSVFSQGLKHYVFEEHYRPLKYFSDTIQIHHLAISNSLYNHSFPSGHSVSIFTLITVVIAFIKSRKYDLVLLLIAFLVAYSRVYLGQHFVEDVVFGSFLGVIAGTLTAFIFNHEQRYSKPILQLPWANKEES